MRTKGFSSDNLAAAPDCYWVIEGKLMAGEHPGWEGDEALAERVAWLMRKGIDRFIDLTSGHEYGMPRYEKLLDKAAEGTAQVVRMPIGDFDVPTPAQMSYILDLLDSLLAEGHLVYVHCFNGTGRTGTVIGCYLVRHGAAGREALSQLAAMRRKTRKRDHRSPETIEQEYMVLTWEEMDAKRRD
jgi:hypothetical protein